MFIIELTYKVPLEEIDAHMQAHVAYLNKYYKLNNLLFPEGKFLERVG